MTSLIYKQHNYKKSAHHKKNLLAHRAFDVSKLSTLKVDPIEVFSGSPDQSAKINTFALQHYVWYS